MMFLDEYDNIITEDELKAEFIELKASGDTDAETFTEYVTNCTSKNGTLTIVR